MTTKTLSAEKMAKLPKWARNQIEMLYANINSLDVQRVRLFGKSGRNPMSQVVLPGFHGINMDDDDHQPLPDTQGVRFYTRPRDESHWSEYIDFRLDAQRERVYVHGAIGGIVIEPSSSNTCYLGLQDRGV